MTDVDILRHAQKLVSKGWCRNSSAKNQWAVACKITDSEATSFCPLGSIHRACYDLRDNIENWETKSADIANIFQDAVGNTPVHKWNDVFSRTQEEVLEMFDKSIETVESKQPELMTLQSKPIFL